MKKQHLFCTLVFALGFLCTIAYSHQVLVNTLDGEAFTFDMDPSESLQSLQEKIEALVGEKSAFLMEIATDGSAIDFGIDLTAARSPGGPLGCPRKFYQEVSANEKADIRFIVTTLANKSLIAIAFAKEDLELAGERIDHLHPLRFLMTIFTDEELKVGIRNIRGKGWVWNHFVRGLKDCLTTERQIENMKTEYITDFSKIVKIDSKIIMPAIQEQKWDDFVELLITHIPRLGYHDRYDT